MTLADARATEFVAAADELGEGPTWFADEAVLRWVDILRGRLHAVRLDGSDHQVRQFDHPVSAVVPRRGGGLAVAGDSGVLLLGPGGELEAMCPVEPRTSGNRLGDVGVDPAGRLWLGTLDREMLVGRGALYRLDPDRRLTQVLSGTSVANGIGWSPEGDRMYFIDSATWRVDVLDYDVRDGSATDRRPWVSIDHADGSPDGLAVDADGGVWVALWAGGQVRRYTAQGRLDAVLPVPVRQVTSCCFAGPELDVLAITSARVEMDQRSLQLEPSAGSVFLADPGVRGLPQMAFAG
ncbi:MAG: SMP-30/gluconolactonase/LRE family protein [Angustibacter sp.]